MLGLGNGSKITTEQVARGVLGRDALERLGPPGSNKYLGIKRNFVFCFVVFALEELINNKTQFLYLRMWRAIIFSLILYGVVVTVSTACFSNAHVYRPTLFVG